MTHHLRSEEYPLLNPEEESDKSALHQPPVIPVVCDVSCVPKRPTWVSRWPQLLSACWMSVVLLAILFVIFYAFGSIQRLQSRVTMLKYESKPAGEVYYHHIVPSLSSRTVPFKTFTNYLSFMATEYPMLTFNVYLLIDDTPQSSFYSVQMNSMRFKRFLPRYTIPINYLAIKSSERDIQEFQRNHPNVKVSIKSLKKYTEGSPLQLEWRSMPVTYLPFYLRAYEVWRKGGIGLNLWTQNYRFNMLRKIDLKLDTILKQHSKSVDLNKYIEALKDIDTEDERNVFTFLYDAFNEIPRIFQWFYTFGIMSDYEEKNYIPTAPIKTNHTISSHTIVVNKTSNNAKSNVSNIRTDYAYKMENEALNITRRKNTTNYSNIATENQNYSGIGEKDKNPINVSHIYPVYDLSRLIDVIDSYYEIVHVENVFYDHKKNDYKNFLTLDSDGSTIVAYSRNHPLLYKVLFTPGFFNYSPRYIISDNIAENCFRSMNRAYYCDSVKIFNNVS